MGENKTGAGELKADFDTTAELWDRLADDLARGGSPCIQTVEGLVEEACRLDVSKTTGEDPGRGK